MRHFSLLFQKLPLMRQALLEKQLDKIVSDAKGSIISYERWGKYDLPIRYRGYDYGVYYLMRFEVEDAQTRCLA